MNIAGLVTSYKKSILIFTSVQMKLFDYLKKPIHKNELSKVLALHPLKIELFLEALYSIDLLYKGEKGFFQNTEATNKYLVSSSNSFLGELVKLEQHVYENFITINNLYQSLKSDYQICDDLITNTFSQSYQNVVYHKIQYLKLVREYKRIKDIPSITYLIDKIPKEICSIFERHTNQKIVTINIVELLACKWNNCNIILPNLIHYLDTDQLKSLLSNSNANVNIFIIDFFGDLLEEQSMTDRKSELYLDWITHGGIEHLNYSEVTNIFNSFKFENILNIKDKENGFTLIFRKN